MSSEFSHSSMVDVSDTTSHVFNRTALNNRVVVVECLKKELADVTEHVAILKRKLDVATAALQKQCNDEVGHDYCAERDSDYHSSGWDYTCSVCGYWTRMRPEKFRYKSA